MITYEKSLLSSVSVKIWRLGWSKLLQPQANVLLNSDSRYHALGCIHRQCLHHLKWVWQHFSPFAFYPICILSHFWSGPSFQKKFSVFYLLWRTWALANWTGMGRVDVCRSFPGCVLVIEGNSRGSCVWSHHQRVSDEGVKTTAPAPVLKATLNPAGAEKRGGAARGSEDSWHVIYFTASVFLPFQ